MRLLIVAFSVAMFAAQGLAAPDSAATNKKSSASKKSFTVKRTSKATPKTTASAVRSTTRPVTRSTTRRTTSKSSKKPAAAAASRRSMQQQPTPERYKEIQQALAGRGCFSGPADGNWGPESVDALKRFQREQNLTDDGKIGSLSLIALGLGPKRVARVDAASEKSVQQQ